MDCHWSQKPNRKQGMNWWKSGHTELFFLEGAKTQDIDSNWELIYLSYFHCPGQHYTARIYKKKSDSSSRDPRQHYLGLILWKRCDSEQLSMPNIPHYLKVSKQEATKIVAWRCSCDVRLNVVSCKAAGMFFKVCIVFWYSRYMIKALKSKIHSLESRSRLTKIGSGCSR